MTSHVRQQQSPYSFEGHISPHLTRPFESLHNRGHDNIVMPPLPKVNNMLTLPLEICADGFDGDVVTEYGVYDSEGNFVASFDTLAEAEQFVNA